MPFRLLADLVLLAHAGFVLFVVLGALLAIRWPRMAWIHLPACLWAVLLELFRLPCPLTPLEVSLRRAAGDAAYSEGFIEHYLVPIVYPAGLTPQLQLLLAVLVIVINTLLYWAVFRLRTSDNGN